MLEDFFTRTEAERLLFNRKAAVVLGVCAILPIFFVAFEYGIWDFLPSSKRAAEVVFWSVILPASVSGFVLFAGTGLFIFRCGPQPPRDTLWWALMLMFAFPFAEIAIYLFLYMPALRSRLNGSEQTL
jgi:hypothetical protein